MKLIKSLFITLFVFISTTFAQSSDNIITNINPSSESIQNFDNFIDRTIVDHVITKDILENREFYSGIDCYNGTTYTDQRIKISLKSGTSWEIGKPPHKPFMFAWKVLFKSGKADVVNRFNYCEIISYYGYFNNLPYDLIDNIIVYWDINPSETKCASVRYEVIPEGETLNIMNKDIINFE